MKCIKFPHPIYIIAVTSVLEISGKLRSILDRENIPIKGEKISNRLKIILKFKKPSQSPGKQMASFSGHK